MTDRDRRPTHEVSGEGPGRKPFGTGPRSLRTVELVARREFVAQVRSRAYVIGLLLTTLGIVAAAIVAGMVAGDDRSVEIATAGPAPAGLVETGRSADLEIVVAEHLSAEEARARVAAGDADVALVPSGPAAYTAVVDESLDPATGAVLTTVLQERALEQAVRAAGGDPDVAAAAYARAGLRVEVLHPPDTRQAERLRTSWVVLLLMVTSVLGSGIYVAMSVVEEKSNRVVELLLATLRPVQLLWGKVLGIGAAGLLQVVVTAGVALIAGRAAGLVSLDTAVGAAIASTVVWFVLGYLLFALLYAAAGALVSRQEEVQGATAPLLLLVMFAYGASAAVVREPDGGFARVLAWVPPVSVFVVPVRTAAGVAPGWEIAGSLLVVVLTCAGIATVAARVYAGSVLHVGERRSWRTALRG